MLNIATIFCFLLYLVFVVAPMSNFLHELGHALGAILVKADKVKIMIGKGNKIKSIGTERRMLDVNSWYFIGGLTESSRDKPFNKKEKILILVFAPIFNGFVAIIFYFIFTFYPNIFVEIVIWYNLWLMLSNLIPFEWDGKQTDGYSIYKLMCK